MDEAEQGILMNGTHLDDDPAPVWGPCHGEVVTMLYERCFGPRQICQGCGGLAERFRKGALGSECWTHADTPDRDRMLSEDTEERLARTWLQGEYVLERYIWEGRDT